jgi:hypothetical protein
MFSIARMDAPTGPSRAGRPGDARRFSLVDTREART